MNKWAELLLGLILVIIPILIAGLLYPPFWFDAKVVLLGGIFWGVVGIGLLFLLLGISDLRN